MRPAGWLVKQGHTLLSGWTRRWFSLHCRGATVPATAGSAAEEGTDARSSSSDGQQQRQELVLEYFEDEAKTAARKKGEFVLLPGSAVQRWADTDKHEHCVRLSNSSGVYIIAGRDSSEATEWVQALLEALWTHQVREWFCAVVCCAVRWTGRCRLTVHPLFYCCVAGQRAPGCG